MDVYRQILRGDYNRPFPIYLQLMNFTLPEMLRLLPVEDQARDALIGSAYHHDTAVTAGHLRGLLDAYLSARQSILRRHRLHYEPNTALEREILRKINR